MLALLVLLVLPALVFFGRGDLDTLALLSTMELSGESLRRVSLPLLVLMPLEVVVLDPDGLGGVSNVAPASSDGSTESANK